MFVVEASALCINQQYGSPSLHFAKCSLLLQAKSIVAVFRGLIADTHAHAGTHAFAGTTENKMSQGTGMGTGTGTGMGSGYDNTGTGGMGSGYGTTGTGTGGYNTSGTGTGGSTMENVKSHIPGDCLLPRLSFACA